MENRPLLCLTNNFQGSLSTAFKKRDLAEFTNILATGVNPQITDHNVSLSIFEKCCQTPKCSEYIRACMKARADCINKESEIFSTKRPINFVVESKDVENLAALLENTFVKINNVYESCSPLQLLASNLSETDETFETTINCMKRLIDSRANVNIPDNRGITPILTIAKNKNISHNRKEEIIKYFLDKSFVDLDTYRNGEARTFLNNNFNNLDLPVFNSEIEWDNLKLLHSLKENRKDHFSIGFNSLITTKKDTLINDPIFIELILKTAIEKEMIEEVQLIFRSGIYDITQSNTLIKSACGRGCWKILKLMLQNTNINVNEPPVLIDVVKNIGSTESGLCDYSECFEILINNPSIDVNQKDSFGNTALHIAVKYNNQNIILTLLKKGAFIGIKNKFRDYSITDIDPNLLEKHFDDCITTNTDYRFGDDNFEIILDFTNFVPANARQIRVDEKSKVSKEPLNNLSFDEMESIEYMAKSNELNRLVKHPLVASFLFLKWHRLALIFYSNFACYTIYCFSIILYLLLCYCRKDPSKELFITLYTLTAFGGLYLLIREIGQLIISTKEYLKNKENYLEIAIICMTIVVLSGYNYEESKRRTLAAFTILLAVCEFFLLTGSLPILSFSTHLVMLKTVSKSFLKSLLLYSIILIAFALCFYTLLGVPDNTNTNQSNTKKNEIIPNENLPNNNQLYPTTPTTDEVSTEEEDEFNKFLHPGIAIIKTVVMLTGEFDASSINFNQNISSYLIFLIFVFLISTVLFNLLNGLAVSDTQAIKTEAELMNFIYRAELMTRYEKILLGKGESDCFNFIIRKLTSNRLNLFPNYLPLNKIRILPNLSNIIKISVHATKLNDLEQGEQVNHRDLKSSTKSLNCCAFDSRSFLKMESKIVKYAQAVLKNKKRKNDEDKEKQEYLKRLINIESKVNDIYNFLKKEELTPLDTDLQRLTGSSGTTSTNIAN